MFNLAVRKYTTTQIANELNARGLRTRKRTSRSGRETGGRLFTSDSVLKILRDPIYRGLIEYRGEAYPSSFPALVNERTWRNAQAALDRQAPVRARRFAAICSNHSSSGVCRLRKGVGY